MFNIKCNSISIHLSNEKDIEYYNYFFKEILPLFLPYFFWFSFIKFIIFYLRLRFSCSRILLWFLSCYSSWRNLLRIAFWIYILCNNLFILKTFYRKLCTYTSNSYLLEIFFILSFYSFSMDCFWYISYIFLLSCIIISSNDWFASFCCSYSYIFFINCELNYVIAFYFSYIISSIFLFRSSIFNSILFFSSYKYFTLFLSYLFYFSSILI